MSPRDFYIVVIVSCDAACRATFTSDQRVDETRRTARKQLRLNFGSNLHFAFEAFVCDALLQQRFDVRGHIVEGDGEFA
jgi:hypothetical protein